MSNEGFFTDDIDDRYRYARRDRNTFRKPLVGIVDVHEDEEEEEIQYCPHCLEGYGGQNKLGARILEKDKPIPIDHELWLQCYVCGNIYGKHEIEKQKNLQVAELKGHVTDNPFDTNKHIVTGIPKRSSPQGKKASAKRKRERDRPHHKDKEIDEEMRRHGDRVTVLEDTDP